MPQNDMGGLGDGKPWVSMPLSQNKFNHADLHNLSGIRILYKCTFDTTNSSWLLALYARSTLCIMANRTCMALQQLSAKQSWNVCIVKLF